MKLFIATRWGNPFEADGPDGKDTNFLVRAPDLPTVAILAESVLQNYPLSVDGNRPVHGFIHFIKQVGEDPTSEVPAVILGPWIEYTLIKESNYQEWHRDRPRGKWYEITNNEK
jgi:hypothetical protein